MKFLIILNSNLHSNDRYALQIAYADMLVQSQVAFEVLNSLEHRLVKQSTTPEFNYAEDRFLNEGLWNFVFVHVT